MKTRILAGLAMLPLLLVIYFGGSILWVCCLAIGIMAIYEFYRGFKAMDSTSQPSDRHRRRGASVHYKSGGLRRASGRAS